MAPVLDEQSRRRFVALEAQALGRGGVSLMAQITGLSRRTIYHGLSDIGSRLSVEPGRVRKVGGGRKKKVLEDPTLLIDLKNLVEPSTRGDLRGRPRRRDSPQSFARHGLQPAVQQQDAGRRPAHRP